MTKKQVAVEQAISDLMQALGYDRSESATEAFTGQLQLAAASAQSVIERSHAEGLCYNCVPVLAERLIESTPRLKVLKRRRGVPISTSWVFPQSVRRRSRLGLIWELRA